MNVIATPQNHAGKVDAQPPVEDAVPVFPSPITQAAVTPEPLLAEVLPPRWGRKVWIAGAVGLLTVTLAASWWKHAATASALFDLVPPYSSAIAFVLLGVIGAFYKDKYRHTVAKWSAVTIMVVSGFLMGVNTYRDRAARAQEKLDRAKEKYENAQTTEGIIKSVEKVSGELKDLREKVKPDEIRGEMADLKFTMDKVINPPKAELLFSFSTFVNPPVDGKTVVPARVVTLPLNPDGSVHVTFVLVNNTEVPAKGVQVGLEICHSCKFAREPEGFAQNGKAQVRVRVHSYGDMPAAAVYEELAADIIPPPGVPAFDIQVTSRCDNCVLQRIGTIGKVHIQRN